jgi:hypothetical protein
MLALAACRTTLVTTSDTSRQASSARSSGTCHSANASDAIRRASLTMIGWAGNVRSSSSSSSPTDLTTRIAMSSSISPGTASVAASAMRSTDSVETLASSSDRTRSVSSSSGGAPSTSRGGRRSTRPSV